jgi:hypothetical protein
MQYSNQAIDQFIESLYCFGVSDEDIQHFREYSSQFELSQSIVEKSEILDILFEDFQRKYPDIYPMMEQEMHLVVYRNFH